jgi:hypothetical protein
MNLGTYAAFASFYLQAILKREQMQVKIPKLKYNSHNAEKEIYNFSNALTSIMIET